jgi:hypothetical protein
MGEDDETGVGLAAAIEALRDDLLRARAGAAGQDIQLPIDSMTVELQVVATRGADGKAGFRVPVVNLGVDGGVNWSRESTQTVTVQFGAPLGRDGNPVKVAQSLSELPG